MVNRFSVHLQFASLWADDGTTCHLEGLVTNEVAPDLVVQLLTLITSSLRY